jgi:hypothetical protein
VDVHSGLPLSDVRLAVAINNIIRANNYRKSPLPDA